MKFDLLLDRYAELICRYGLNVQSGQIVRLSAEPVHQDLVNKITKKSYELGAKYVNTFFYDPLSTRLRVDYSESQYLDYTPEYISSLYNELLDNNAASCSIIGPMNPEALEGVDPKKINKIRMAQYLASKSFRDQGIDEGKIQWCVVSAPTPLWSKKIYPDLSERDANLKFWNELFKICRVDSENFLDLWEEHDLKLKNRSKFLNECKLSALHFTGPGTDLKVFLSDRAEFTGGRSQSAQGVLFEPNIPTEECFTTPDFHRTSGYVTATRPFKVNGCLIEDLRLEFANGEVINAEAKRGLDIFKAYLESDKGAKRLGEVALVGTDSPIYQTGLIFDEVLLDENAACHIALGSAYKKCIKDSLSLTENQLLEIGVNESSVHQDIMISSEKVSVSGLDFNQNEIPIIQNGKFVIKETY